MGLLVTILALGAAGAGMLAMGLLGGQEAPSAFEVPELKPGAHATYEASGNYTNAFGDPLVGERDDVPPNSTLYVNASRMEVPDASGRPTDALVVTLDQPAGVMLRNAQADGHPLAMVTPDAVPHGGFGNEPFGNLTRVDYRVGLDPNDPQLNVHLGLGFAEVPLLSGLTVPEDGISLADASPLGNAMVNVTPSYTDWRIEPVEHEDGFELEITSGGGDVHGSYVFEDNCPFPVQVRIPGYPTGTEFEADRTSCEVTEPEPDGGKGWPTPSTSTIERRFPGEGEALPLHYREAFEFFLTLPETDAYTDENPDWMLYCAKLIEQASTEPLHSNWSWRFKLTGDSGNQTGWVTRTEAPDGTEGPWTRDRSPAEHLANPCREGPDAPLRGAVFADLDESLETFETIFEPSIEGGDVDLRGVSMGPLGTSITLDRCGPYVEEQGGGFCGERAPWVQFARDGRVMFVELEPPWFASPLAPIAGP